MMKIDKDNIFVFAEKEALGCVLTLYTKKLVEFIRKQNEKIK